MQEVLYRVLLSIGIGAGIVVLGYVVGRLSRTLTRVFLERVGFDDWFRRVSIGRAIIRGGYSPSEFFGYVVSWIVYIASVLIAVSVVSYDVSVSLGGEPHLYEVYVVSRDLLNTYLVGFVKAFLVILVGFILVDTFIGYIYKISELRSDTELLTPVAEYLRILLYINTVVFSLEVGGVRVSSFVQTLQPVIWGLTAIMVSVVVAHVVSRVVRR